MDEAGVTAEEVLPGRSAEEPRKGVDRMSDHQRDEVDVLAYRFWSIHPREIDRWAKTAPKMPNGYMGGMRAWLFACEIRNMLSAPSQGGAP